MVEKLDLFMEEPRRIPLMDTWSIRVYAEPDVIEYLLSLPYWLPLYSFAISPTQATVWTDPRYTDIDDLWLTVYYDLLRVAGQERLFA